jgi:UPF0716 protein FxsA
VLRRAQRHLDRGELPVGEVFTGLCLLVAGALLLTPGFLTDAVGFALFVPPIRDALGRFVLRRLLRRGKASLWINGMPVEWPEERAPGNGPGGTVIDGEYVEVRPENEPDDPSGKVGGTGNETPER